jgi:hypothetical protein
MRFLIEYIAEFIKLIFELLELALELATKVLPKDLHFFTLKVGLAVITAIELYKFIKFIAS